MLDLDDVLAHLDTLLEESNDPISRGYFPRIYRRLVLRVKRESDSGRFEDASRVGRLFSVQSSRYLRAAAAHRAGNDLPLSWEVALSFASQGSGTVLQQLLLGVNALLNLELGVSAATVMRGQRFDGLVSDFEQLQQILIEHLTLEESGLIRIAPILQWVGSGMGKPREWLLSESARQFHESPWEFGRRLSELDPAFWPAAIADRDSLTSELAWKIAVPSIPARMALHCLRMFERPDVLVEFGRVR